MFVAWAVFPLVLVAVCLGCGLLVERVAGWELSLGLVVSVGLALVIVVATLTTDHEKTASLTTGVAVALAVAGYASSWRRLLLLRPRGWSLAVGLGVYCVAAAPVVMSGSASFLGYFVLNDSVIHLTLIDHMLAHGRDLSGLAPSAYQAILRVYLSTGYPIGAQVALGAVRPLVGQDAAWLLQPYLAVIVALGGVVLYELLDGVVRVAPLRALCAFIAAQAGLYYAFYLEASIKEVATTWIVTLTVALVVVTLRAGASVRRVLPLLVTVVAGLDVLEVAIGPWLVIPLGSLAVVVAWRLRHAVQRVAPARLALTAAGALALAAVLAVPIITRASKFFEVAKATLTSQGDLGNLTAPLQKWELFGIWPSGDFRLGVRTHFPLTYALIGLAAGSAVFGALWLWRHRERAAAPLLLVVGNTITAAYLLTRASPYASAKVMAIFSVTVVLAAMLGAVALHEQGRRLEGWALAIAIAGGVLWTNYEGYRGSSVAPRDRLAELSSIGDRFAGPGPTFYNQSDELAAYFLRRSAPADVAFGVPTPRAGLPPRTPGQSRLPWDPDEIALANVESYPLLVLGRSPRISRPPADFALTYEGRFYDVWKREPSPAVLAHYALGGPLQPSAVPRCGEVRSIAAKAARAHARLAYAQREPAPALVPTLVSRPPNWGEIDGEPYGLIPRQETGSVSGTIAVPRAGSYEIWLEGDFGSRVSVSIGGRRVGSVSYELGPPGQFVLLADATLAAGTLPVVITWPGSGLRPGAEGVNRLLGPLMLVPSGAQLAVAGLAPAQARSLCGRSLDWIEIVR